MTENLTKERLESALKRYQCGMDRLDYADKLTIEAALQTLIDGKTEPTDPDKQKALKAIDDLHELGYVFDVYDTIRKCILSSPSHGPLPTPPNNKNE